ncbi:MAG: formylmethanofuran dehydrogenase subunit C [Candidatus Methanomethylicota archaeon]|uniref:formylmethanofuran dehydrogenase n=1 Tax=Thermoproteota archaeon TaxID=2056631 RepID=A0A497ERL6_9CREN|nr:MAG: formylmethanofuran dehydrogenase subunit C [Candidatus Verstraetearchaeota archaeon]
MNGEICEIIIKPKKEFKVPVEVDVIKPENFAGKSLNEILGLVVYEGNKERKLGELFEVVGEPVDDASKIRIIIEGSTRKLWSIGAEMTTGEIIVKGDVGHYLGMKMKGGSILVHGNVGSWIGAEMTNGTIEIHGNAGDYIGARFRGERPEFGMKGGKIVIHGNAGVEVGRGMIKGTIIIDGNCLEFLGANMKGGSILVKGNCTRRIGSGMTGGKIIVCGHVDSILPSFYIEDISKTAKVKGVVIEGPFYLFLGDYMASTKANGRLFISISNNPHLKKFLELIEGGE